MQLDKSWLSKIIGSLLTNLAGNDRKGQYDVTKTTTNCQDLSKSPRNQCAMRRLGLEGCTRNHQQEKPHWHHSAKLYCVGSTWTFKPFGFYMAIKCFRLKRGVKPICRASVLWIRLIHVIKSGQSTFKLVSVWRSSRQVEWFQYALNRLKDGRME